MAITPDGTINGLPAEYALTVLIQPLELSGRPGEKKKHYHQKALEVLGRLNRGLYSISSDAEFESIDGLALKAYELGK